MRQRAGTPPGSGPAAAWRRRRREFVAALLALAVVWAGLSQVTVSAFSSVTGTPMNTLTTLSLDPFIPASASAARAGPTSCTVSWTVSAASSPPGSLTYDVTDGSGTTLATAVSGLTTSITIGSPAVTPTVKARVGTWVSAAARTSGTTCLPVPDAPTGLALTAGDSLLVASWTAPSGNGSAVTGSTVSAVPSGGGATVTCTPSPATSTTCALTGLTNGVSYAVTVVATNANGTGPASAAVSGTPIAGRALDGLTATSAAAYSVRRLRAAYTGYALRVRRASDNTTSDIGFDANGDLDTAALATFCASTSCYLRTWYDQSGQTGNGARDLTQTTNAAQPRIVNAGVVDTSGGRPTLVFSGAQALVTGAAVVTIGTTSLSANAVGYAGSGSASYGRFLSLTANGQTNDYDNTSSSDLLRTHTSGTLRTGRNNASLSSISATTTQLTAMSTVFDGSTDVLYLGTTAGSSVSSSGSFGATGALNVGANRLGDANSILTGAVSEATLFTSALGSTDRYSLNASQSAYYLLPDAPTGLTATPGDTTATLSWTAPTRTGVTALTGYTVTAVPTDTTLATRTCTSTPPTTTCGLTGLTDGAAYTVTATATSSTGTGPASTAVTLVPVPALLTSTNAQLWLDGKDPDGDGVFSGTAESCDTATTCATLSNALKRWVDKSGKNHHAVQSTTAMAGTYTPASGAVSFNANGYYQAASIGVGPDVTAFAVAQSTSSTWNVSGWLLGTRSANGFILHPTSGGSNVKTVAMFGDATNSQAVNTASQTVSGITSLHLYDGQVSGTSSISATLALDGITGAATTTSASGAQQRSATSLTLVIGADDYDLTNRRATGSYRELVVFNRALTAAERRTVQEYLARRWAVTIPPSPLTGLTVAAGDTTATPSWTAPSWDGGASTSGYTVTATPTAGTGYGSASTRTCTATPPTTTCSLTGLTNGLSYSVSVTATNSVGTSLASSTVTVIPYPATVISSSATKLWLDGADSSSLLASSGCTGVAASTTVGCWKDKSSTANNASQATGANQPSLTTMSVRSVPGFSPSKALSIASTGLPAGTTSSTTFQALTMTSSTSTMVPLMWGSGTGSSRVWWISYGSGDKACVDTSGAGPSACTSNGFTAGSPAVYSSSLTSSGDDIALNGAPTASASGAVNTTAAGGSVGYLNGPIAETIVLSGALNSTDRRTVEEYLARKWTATITPGRPGTPTATATNAQAAVSWTAPSWDGGSAITGYTVTASPGGATCSTATTSCTVTGLTNGTAYTFTVTATNTAGVGPASAASAAATPPGPPGTPTAVTTVAGDAQLTVSWTAPGTGTPYTSYTATAVPSDGTLTTLTCTSATSPCTITGLTDGASYSVTVTATNAAGTGSASSAATGIPYPASVMTSARLMLWLDGADASTMFANSGCSTTLTTTVGCWKDKSSQANNATAGSAPSLATVNGRSVPSFDGSASYLGLASPANLPNGSTSSTEFAVAKLADATPSSTGYRVVLDWGANSSGASRTVYKYTGAATAAFDTRFGSYSTPGSWSTTGPTLMVAEAVSGSARTALNGGGYGSGTSMTLSTGTTTASVGRNVANQSYWNGPVPELLVFTGTLTSAERRTIDEYLARKWAITIAPGIPSAATANAGNASAAVSWTAPSWNGGAAITSYTVTASPGGATCTATYPTSSCTVTGLTNGTAYTFTVTATNSVGVGPASAATSSVTPVTTPGAPTGVSVTAGDGQLAASWTAPASTGGSAITSYTATATPSAGTGYGSASTQTCTPSPATNTSCTITGLTDGITYSVTVTASNAVGTGTASTAASGIPYPATVMVTGTMSAWFDADKTGSLLAPGGGAASSGGKIGTWVDSGSGALNATQATTANQPTVASIGSRKAMLSTATTWLTGSSGTWQTVIAVANPNRAATFNTLFASAASTDTSVRIVGGALTTSPNANDWASSTSNEWANSVVASTPDTTSTAVVYSAIGTSSRTGTFSLSTGFAVSGVTRGLDGTMGELATFNRALSTSERRSVEEYLARKWLVSIAPQAPTIGTVTGGDTTASVSWTAPSWDGGDTVSSSTIVATPVDGSLSTITKTGCSSSPCTVTGLTNGATYGFTVAAVNGIGTGPASSSVNGSGYPSTLFTSSQLKVWLDAQYDPALSAATDCSGSSASTGTGIGCWKDRSGNGWNAPRLGSTSAVLTASAINSRPALRFVKSNPDVYQVSSSGIGAVGSADRTLLAVLVARTSYGTSSTNYAGTAVAWNVWNSGIMPKANSGSTTTIDLIQSDAYNSSTTGAYASATSTSPALAAAVYSSSGGTLTNGLALNGKGSLTTGTVSGSWYSYTDNLRIGATGTVASANYAYPLDGDLGEILVFNKALTAVERRTAEEYLARHWGLTIAPAAPTLSTVTKPSSGNLTATWTAPSWNGGASVSSYTATATASGQTTRTCSTASTSCTIASLTSGVSYAVTVTATNSVAAGPASNSINGTP